MKRVDLTQKTFGRLLVLGYSFTKNGIAHWECQCECGNRTTVKSYYLTSGDTKSCGCLKNPNPESFFLSSKFGMLQPIEKIIRKTSVCYKCRCDCGNISIPFAHNLLSGTSTSCGCSVKWTEFELKHKIFTHLEVLTVTKGMAKCLCICGSSCFVRATDLVNKRVKSCGCRGRRPDSYFLTTKFTQLQPFERVVKDGAVYWKCLCDCGNISLVLPNNLISTKTKSCGCLKQWIEKEVIGKKFKHLTILKKEVGGVVCQCDCGNTIKRDSARVMNGHIESCGCGRRRDAELRWSKKKYTKKGITEIRIHLSTSSIKPKIIKRDNYTCQICSAANPLQMHHIIPVKEDWSMESTLNKKNLITLCKTCHIQIAHGKTTSHIDENIKSFLQWRIERIYSRLKITSKT